MALKCRKEFWLRNSTHTHICTRLCFLALFPWHCGMLSEAWGSASWPPLLSDEHGRKDWVDLSQESSFWSPQLVDLSPTTSHHSKQRGLPLWDKMGTQLALWQWVNPTRDGPPIGFVFGPPPLFLGNDYADTAWLLQQVASPFLHNRRPGGSPSSANIEAC